MRIMRIHTAAHILYYKFTDKFGKQKVVGSNITDEKGRVDFLYSEPVSDALPELEKQVNDTIAQNLPVKTWPDESDPNRRWWEVEGLGKMPCGGTHVRATGEVGEVRIKRKNIGAGKERIELTLLSP